jgi:DDE superfamily endonuclease
VASSMAWQAGPGQRAAGSALDQLKGFRRDAYRCGWRRADALFELGDALLTAPRVPSLPFLSEEPVMRRGHGMIYQGLDKGRIDEERLREVLVAHRPAEWPCVFGIDASTIARPAAVTSPGREFHHHSCAGHTGSGDPVIKGWAWQWLSHLNFDADSWTAPQDAIQVGREDVAAATARQITAHAARLRRHGETRVPLYVMDAGYDEAPLTWDLGDHLDQVQILVRVRNDRVMYRDPAPEPPRPGRPRRHGQDRFECADPATRGEPDQVLIRDDDRYGRMTVMSWGGLHPKLACRGRFEQFTEPPVIRCHLIRVTVEHLPGGRVVPGPLWLWWAGPGQPGLELCARAYLHRFDMEHAYRFAKTTLNWAGPALRDPAQFGRWTWIVICAINQLRLARPLAEDHRHAWERRRKPGKLTPGRVRRDFARLVLITGTPASPPKPSRAGPGRPRGRRSTPATRHDVIKKAA